MDRRLLPLAAVAIAAGLFGLWQWSRPTPLPATENAADALPGADDSLPIPPVPPRLGEGEEYERCLAMLPRDPSGARSFAEAWSQRGGGEQATHCQALSLEQLGSPAEGARMLQELGASGHGTEAERAEILAQAGQAWLMAGDNEHSYEAATLALALSPSDPDLLIDHAVVAGALGHFEEARDDATRALQIDPRRGDALVLLASAERHLGHLDRAEDDVARALVLDPDDVEALLERGILRERQGDAEGARRDWERAVSLEPDSATADLAQQDLALLDAGPERR